MKKFFLYSLFAIGLLCSACDPVENTYHHTALYHPASGLSLLYADQTKDSISFVSFDSYTLTLHGDWIHAREQDLSGTVPSGAYVEGSIYFTFDVNTTGEQRDCHVVLNSYGNDFYAYYRQYPYLNITRPAVKDGAYQREVKYDAEKDSLLFQVYGDWTLEFNGEKPAWVDWQQGAVTSGEAGKFKVVYTLQKNTTLDSRSAKFTLTSNGVSTDISLVQQNQRD